MMIWLQFRQYRRRMANIALTFGLIGLILALAFSLTGGVALAAPLAQTAPDVGQAAALSIIGFGGAPEGTAAGLVVVGMSLTLLGYVLKRD